MKKLQEECTEKDILILGGDLNAHRFQPIGPEQTEQMKRHRRKNTYPKTVPNDIMNEYGGRSAFIRKIRDNVFN